MLTPVHTIHTQHTYMYTGADLKGCTNPKPQTPNPKPYTGAELEGYTNIAPVG
jgi:hypothetical protein